MARPKTPLISRRAALEAALGIVDREGLDALSIRRLGHAMNVNGASLYHYFKGKNDILIGITQLVLEDVTAPRADSASWRSWLPANAERTRRVLVAYPELIPLMLERNRLGIGERELSASVRRMEDEGVPLEAIAPLIHSLELLAILSAQQEIAAAERASAPTGHAGSEELEPLHRAEAASRLNGDELFEVLATAMINTIEIAVGLKTSRSRSRAPGRATPKG
jgi:TetR/AcrR family transcriptional regulator, tetracycline repressor protein